MITVDAPISFLVGGGIALACRERGGRGVRRRDQTLVRGLLFQSAVLTPIILFFMVRFPDWEWNYMFDAAGFFFGERGGAAGHVILAAIVAALNLSFYAGFRAVEALLARGRAAAAQRVLVGTGVLIGAIIAAMYRETLFVGSLAEFEAGDAQLIFTHLEFLIVQTVAGVLVGGGLLAIIAGNRRSAAAA